MTPQTPTQTSQPDLWFLALQHIRQRVNDQSFRTWLEPARYQKLENGILYLEVPDKFYGDWLRDHYHEMIKNVLQELTHTNTEIQYVLSERPITSHAFADPPSDTRTQELGLNNRYTFENFVIGPGNRFAHAAALAVSDAPARNYNPLFIYGHVGLGKTHLLQAVAHHLLTQNSSTKVVYISGEKFTNQLITAIQKRSTEAFRVKFRSADLLLIDDIHFIAGKEATQEEFFHTFNTLYDAHKQIIVSSDRPPKEIPGLEDRLISRFGWGLVADIQPPDFETRVAILKKKMERETVVVPDEVVHFIADKIKSNIRELEGALIRVVAYSQLTGSVVDVRTVEGEVLKETLQEERGNITIDRIQKVICDYFRLKASDLKAKKRSKSIAYPRQIGMYLARQMTDHSLPEIGGYFGGRGHATVIHGCSKIERLLLKGGKIHQTIEELKVLIRNA
ncbi:MAG: chromosomal replication initiation protein DnaA [Omnitrophica bacterium RIFCSPLOWO2_12_FULL_50_11]|nr:MAG: chromosomal replication initiation protein DnaA [Omnitrophica bacterium RIFCSPLOWO2_12_FULL_50_11]